jgi:hypothetical protein
MSFINFRPASYGRRASTNSLEQTIIQKLILLRSAIYGGQGRVNLNAADVSSPSGASPVKEDAAVYGSFLREASIRINPQIRPAQDQAVIATGAFIAFKRLSFLHRKRIVYA